MTVEVSLIVPTRNQAARLVLFLRSLAAMRFHLSWEVVVIDDGSTDLTPAVLRSCGDGIPLRIVTAARKRGRAAARNLGAELSKGRILIFCDGDRVCEPDFIAAHHRSQTGMDNTAITGDVRELYITKLDRLSDAEILTQRPLNITASFHRSRRTPFVTALYEYMSDRPERCVSWLSFLSGNVSLPRELFYRVGGFDESFEFWGYEHFELGYRLAKQGTRFSVDLSAVNFHLAHRRPAGFYELGIERSAAVFRRLHPQVPVEAIVRLSRGEADFDQTAKAMEQARVLAPNGT